MEVVPVAKMSRKGGRWLRAKDLAPELPLRIKQVRREAGLTQGEAAGCLGVGRNTIWRWEAGQNEPSRETLDALAALYKKTVSWFLSTDGAEQEAGPYATDPELEKVVRRLAELPAAYRAVVEGVIEKLEGL